MFASLAAKARALLGDRKANVAMMFGLSLVPMMVATSAGIDFARGVMVHQRMADALDAAALAVGNSTSKPSSCSSSGNSSSQTSCAPLQDLAQRYFDQNYDHTKDADYGTPSAVSISISDQSVTLSANLPLKLTLMGMTTLNVGTPTVSASSTVVWGQTKLWVALVLDNSGSMANGDSGGSKMDALQDAITNSSYGLLKTLQAAAANDGDVQVGIVPFTRSVNVGLSSSSTYLDWGEWEAPPQPIGTNLSYAIANANFSSPSTISFEAWGPGDDCPFTDTSTNWWGQTTVSTKSPFGFKCTSGPSNGAGSVATIPSSGTYKGYICPGIDSGDYNTDHRDRYYNGCWTSTKVNGSTIRVSTGSSATCDGFSNSNCSCSGYNSGRHCDTQKWTHAWVVNNHNTWSGCVMDRQQKNKQTILGSGTGFRSAAIKDYDTSNTQPASNSSVWDDTQFPAENNTACSSSQASVTTLNYNWTSLASKVNAMVASGNTNQAIGVEHGWQMLTTGAPYGTGTLPSGTTKVLILFSDGLNTQDRWYGDGGTEGTVEDGYIDDRENAACTAAKNDGITVYAIYVHIGNNGSSTALQNCASDSTKYYDLTSSSQIKTAFSDIAQKITNLRVSK